VRSWADTFLVALSFVVLAAVPSRVQAQAAPGGAPDALAQLAPRTPSAVTASDFATEATPPQPASADTSALPAWPPPQNSLLARFKEDLSKPLTTKQKLKRAIEQAIFPGIPVAAAVAGIGMASDSRLDRDYGMGGRGFLRRWASWWGDNSVGLFVGDFAAASLLRQDPRYHPEKKRGFGRRLGHALAAALVTQSDDGKTQFNASHLIGIAAGAGASTAWHHSSDRSGAYFAERFGLGLASSAGYNILAEFLFYRKEPRQ
jgi:hypothetical protein